MSKSSADFDGSSNPVLNSQVVDSAELTLVVGDQHPAFGTGVGGDPKVVVADGLAFALKDAADLAVVLAHRLCEWFDLDGALQLLQRSQGLGTGLAFSAPCCSSPSVMTDMARTSALSCSKRARTVAGLCFAM